MIERIAEDDSDRAPRGWEVAETSIPDDSAPNLPPLPPDAKPQPLSHAERGQLGGLKTMERHGRWHFAAIGKAGFKTYCERHHSGNRAAALAGLKACKPQSFAANTPARRLLACPLPQARDYPEVLS